MKEIKFRADLYQRTREAQLKIESREGSLRRIDKQMADLLHDGVRNMTSPDLTALNEQRTAVWNDLRDAQKAKDEVTAEKKKILADAGLDWKQIRITLDDLPATEFEYSIRLGGVRQPMRDEMMNKMLSTGLLKPRANSDLVMAERRGNGPYESNCKLADITAVAKAALDTVADRARMEPEDLGHYETGPSMTPGMRSGFPSTDEILRLVDAERKKGFPREKAIDIVASRLITGDAPQ
jgi:hypothetical protein